MAVICFVVGTRAQLVKMAPVMREAGDRKLPFELWFSGQHRESIVDLMRDFGIEHLQERALGSRERATIVSLAGWLPRAIFECVRFLKRLRSESHEPPIVVVHGDTLTTLVGAVAGRIVGATVAHVESGLSSGVIWSPFPEEMTRRLVFRFIDVAYCPNAAAVRLMRRRRHVRVVDTRQNTILDALRIALGKGSVQEPAGALQQYAVVSVHRFENIYDAARRRYLVECIKALARRMELHFVLHPPTQKRLSASGELGELRGIRSVVLRDRMPYSDFMRLVGHAQIVLTDGGSNQEELALLGVPTVLLRSRSERPDGLGRNIVFEHDLAPSLRQYLLEGNFEELRGTSAIDETARPSAIIVNDLDLISRGLAVAQ